MEKDIFVKKIMEENGLGEDQAFEFAEDILEDLPKELFINIKEWSCGEELSDISLFGFSVNDLYKKRGQENFILALKRLKSYANDPEHFYGWLELVVR